MEKEEFQRNLYDEAKLINIELQNEQIQEFYEYMKLLLEWNEKINLTAITNEKEIIKKHFIDCLTINKYINKNDKIIDIGTGAGFPGIPIKIYNKQTKITLVDSLNKRINFLKEIINKLKLEEIETIHSRAEDLGINKQYREKYDIATTRAVASLNVLVEYMIPFVKIGGKCICMKGLNIEEELNNSKTALEELGGKIIAVDKIKLGEEATRNIIIIEKIKATNNKYPRKSGIVKQKPL